MATPYVKLGLIGDMHGEVLGPNEVIAGWEGFWKSNNHRVLPCYAWQNVSMEKEHPG